MIDSFLLARGFCCEGRPSAEFFVGENTQCRVDAGIYVSIRTSIFMATSLHAKCMSCGSLKLRHLAKYFPNVLMRCRCCGLVFDQRIPSHAELAQHYSIYSYSRRKKLSFGTEQSFNDLLDFFERFRFTNNILDIGCGQGDFLVAARKRGWKVYGTEYSRSAVKLCEEAGITMHEGEYKAGAIGNIVFDVVTCFEVIEHTYDPHDLLSAALSQLKSGGMFYVTTPNFDSILRQVEGSKFRILGYPEHLVLYTPTSLGALLSRYPIRRHKLISTGIDLYRLKSSLFSRNGHQPSQAGSGSLANEAIRTRLAEGKGKIIKKYVNFALSILGVGDTLKAYYVKQ